MLSVIFIAITKTVAITVVTITHRNDHHSPTGHNEDPRGPDKAGQLGMLQGRGSVHRHLHGA